MIEIDTQDCIQFSHHVLFSRDHKLVLFTLPKVACTTFIQLMMRMNGVSDWKGNPHYRPERPFVSRLSPEAVSEMMNSPEWTRSVFLRDPVDRLLSAYLDKIQTSKKLCSSLFGVEREKMSFTHFVSCITSTECTYSPRVRIGRHCDPHWRPQCYIGNLQKFISRINFVGSFNHLESHSRILLSRVGAWQEFGLSGWGPDNARPIFRQNDAANATRAGAKIFQYYTDEMFTMVRKAYQVDYTMIEPLCVGEEPLVGERSVEFTNAAGSAEG